MQNIKISSIERNILNPRKNFDSAKLAELADSIREFGIIEPLVVSAYDVNGEYRFRIIAGERRWKAAMMAGLEEVPCVVRFDLTAEQEIRLALTENLQRQDLDPIEEARAYKLLLEYNSVTQESLAAELGVSQAHIANRLRLLELPDSVQQNISRGIISASHGKVLAGYKNLPEPVLKKAAEVIAEEHVPVAKAAEAIAKIIAEEGKPLFNDYNDYNNRPEFKTEQCEKCEFRAMGNRWGYGDEHPYCVKPGCWEKKQQEVRQDRELALADQVQKEAKKGQGVVELDNFKYDQYEEFRDYKIEGMDLTECQECEHKKVVKKSWTTELGEACFQPSCFKKKQAAATREKNKAVRNAFQVELEKIAELANSTAVACMSINMPRQILVYLAAQILANVSNNYDRKVTRYQYVKEKFGWDDGFFKSAAYHSLNNDWEVFRSRLETLSDQQLWEVIFEWPAVAEGLTGIRSWILGNNLATVDEIEEDVVEQMAKLYQEELDQDQVDAMMEAEGTCRVCGCTDDRACEGGCYWVEPDLCSSCVGEVLSGPGTCQDQPEESEDVSQDSEIAIDDQPTETDPDTSVVQCDDCIHLNAGGICTYGFDSDRIVGPIRSCTTFRVRNIEEPSPKTYIDDQGRLLFVSPGIGGENWMTLYTKPGKNGSHRLKSPSLPLRKTQEEAQADLDAWAAKKGLSLARATEPEPEECDDNDDDPVKNILEIDDTNPVWETLLNELTDEELNSCIQKESRPGPKSKLRQEQRRRKKTA